MTSKSIHIQHSKVSVDYQAAFMKNYVPETAIDGGKGIKAIRLRDDASLIFYIDKLGVLNAIATDSNATAVRTHLALSLPGATVSSFDVHYDEADMTFRLCYALVKDGQSRLLASLPVLLDDEESLARIGALAYREKALSAPKRSINLISMHGDHVLFGSMESGSDALYHYFRGDGEAVPYTLPENTQRVKQLMLGKVRGKAGVFVLYDMSGKEGTMYFASFPANPHEDFRQFRFEATQGTIECFDVFDGPSGNSTLITGGNSIERFTDPSEQRTIASSSGAVFTRIDAARFGDHETVWALGHDKDRSALYYLTNVVQGVAPAGAGWTMPLQMHEGVNDYAAIKGKHFANELFLFSEKDGLIHFWQDAVSGDWREFILSIPDLTRYVEIDTYSMTLRFTALGPEADGKIDISCGEACWLYVNNRLVQLKPAHPYSLDKVDTLDLVYPTASLAAPVLTIQAPFLDSALTLDPSQGVRQALAEKISNGESLSKATRQDGSALIQGDHSAELLDSLAAAISQSVNAAADLGASATPQAPPGFACAAGPAFAYLGNTLGDIFHSVKKGFLEIGSFIVRKVKEGVQFAIEIGGKIVRWVARAAKDALAFIERVWEKVKVFFKDMVDYLAFLFDWQDIVDTKNALATCFNTVIARVPAKIEGLKHMVLAQILTWREKINALEALQVQGGPFDMKADKLAAARGQLAAAPPDARTNWTESKKEVIFGAGRTGPGDLNLDKLNDIKQRTDDPNLDQLIDACTGLFKGELSLGDFVKTVVRMAINLSLTLLEKAAAALFDTLIESIKLVGELLNAPIEVPLLSPIYRKISGNALSLLDFMCLLVAIPMTIGHKLATGKAPFKLITSDQFTAAMLASFEQSHSPQR